MADSRPAVVGAGLGRVAGPFGAAEKLSIPASTLESKIKALDIDKRRFKPDPPSKNHEVPSRSFREAREGSRTPLGDGRRSDPRRGSARGQFPIEPSARDTPLPFHGGR
jgi:hypothetical protein